MIDQIFNPTPSTTMKIEVIFLIQKCHPTQKKHTHHCKTNTPCSTQNLKGTWHSALLILFSVKAIAMH